MYSEFTLHITFDIKCVDIHVDRGPGTMNI